MIFEHNVFISRSVSSRSMCTNVSHPDSILYTRRVLAEKQHSVNRIKFLSLHLVGITRTGLIPSFRLLDCTSCSELAVNCRGSLQLYVRLDAIASTSTGRSFASKVRVFLSSVPLSYCSLPCSCRRPNGWCQLGC